MSTGGPSQVVKSRQFSIYQSHSEMGHYEDLLCLFAKRLEHGRFMWPPIMDESYQLSSAQLALLLEGMDWRRTFAAPLPQRPAIM